MRTINLDARDWRTPVDFLSAPKSALMAPEWCGSSPDAINELMVWGLGPGVMQPPYVVRISNAASAPTKVREHISLVARCVREAREDHVERDGTDVDVSISY
jgi:hypothetical protein